MKKDEEKYKKEKDEIIMKYDEEIKNNKKIHEENMKNQIELFDKEIKKIKEINEKNTRENEYQKQKVREAHIMEMNNIKINHNRDMNMLEEIYKRIIKSKSKSNII